MDEDKKELMKITGIIFGIFIILYISKNLLINPFISDYHFNKGLKYEDEKNYLSALKELTKARDLVPKEPNYQQHLGKIYFNLAAVDKDLKKKDEYLGKAIYEYEKYIKMMPSDVMGYAGLGATFILAGRFINTNYYRKAIIILEEALKIDQNNVDTYNNLGAAYYMANLFDDAVKTFEKGIKIYPKEPDFFYNIGLIYYYKKDYINSKIYYEKALEFNPNHLDAKMGMASLNIVIGNKK